MNELPYTLDAVDKLRKNAHLNKHSHFEASKRLKCIHIGLALPTILINVILGSGYVDLLLKEEGQGDPFFSYAFLAILALFGVGLGAVHTFFNCQKAFESHRSIANRYLKVAKECERVIASFLDNNLDLNSLEEKHKQLNEDYYNANDFAEAYPAINRDYRKSKKIQKQKESDEKSLIDKVRDAAQTINCEPVHSQQDIDFIPLTTQTTL